MDIKGHYKLVSIEKQDQIAVVTIPAFAVEETTFASLSMELTELCSEIAFDKDIRALVISDGRKTEPFSPCDSCGETPEACPAVQDAIAALSYPTLAAITGNAMGAGLELAMACDIRVAAETSRFGLPQIQDGLIPSHGGTQRLPRIVGRGKALEMILTGEQIDADEALRLTLISRKAPEEKVEAVALEMAKLIAEKGPVAVRYAKEAIHKGMDMTIDQGIRLEIDLYMLLHTTADRVEGIEAFRQKRKPVFRGE